MAAPARPGSSEARVPCPLCGGLVHPVAGRCKHCKQDLSTFRAGRPQAAAALPALALKPQNGHANGHAAVPVPALERDSQPILPPRESMSMPAQETSHSAWRRWPVVVIVLAVVAIVGAVAVMVWLPPADASASKSLAPPPAPERMEANPIPPPGDPSNHGGANNADPWGPSPHAQNQAQPQAPQQAQPRQTPDPVPDLQDPFANNIDPLASQRGMGTGGTAFLGQVMRHLCDRLTQCGNGTDPQLQQVCQMSRNLPGAGGAPACDTGKRCLQHVDQMSCSLQSDDTGALMQLMTQIPDCLDAMQHC